MLRIKYRSKGTFLEKSKYKAKVCDLLIVYPQPTFHNILVITTIEHQMSAYCLSKSEKRF